MVDLFRLFIFIATLSRMLFVSQNLLNLSCRPLIALSGGFSSFSNSLLIAASGIPSPRLIVKKLSQLKRPRCHPIIRMSAVLPATTVERCAELLLGCFRLLRAPLRTISGSLLSGSAFRLVPNPV